MTPNDILSYCQSNLKDVVLVESWGERGIFYNPNGVLKRGVYVLTQTSHIKNGICSLKNQYFSSQNSAQAAAEPHSNAFCMYFGSR